MKNKKENRTEVDLSTPWGVNQAMQSFSQRGSFSDSKSASDFIKQRSQVHETYIKEQEKTKRISLVLAAILLISALFIVTFAPEGKEKMSYWIGGALLVFSAGAAGYRRIWAKAPMVEIEADQSD